METEGIERKFIEVLGTGALDELDRITSSRSCLLVSGGQLTGKSTVAGHIAKKLGGSTGSTGLVFRRRAELAGLDIEQLAARHRADPRLDVHLDYDAARTIAAGEVVVFECRTAGLLGMLLRKLGRAELASVHLTCQPTRAAERWIARHAGADVLAAVASRVVPSPDLTFAQALDVLTAEPETAPLRASVRTATGRDERDRQRLEKLYGPLAFDGADEIVDTSCLSPGEVVAEVLAKARSHWSGARTA